MRRGSLLSALLCLLITGIAVAEPGELGVALDLSYWSKWLSKGGEGYGQQGAFFETVDVDLYGTGFGVKVTHRSSISSGYVDKQRFDYRPYFKNQAFKDEPHAMNYSVGVGYEHYYGLSRTSANTTQEWIGAFSWPNLFPNGPVPRYIVHYESPVDGGNANRHVAGWVHRFGLDYDLNSPVEELPLRLSTEIAYTDGLGGAAHDWSFANVGISSRIHINDNLAFVPAVFHQITMDNSISRKKDITYAILSMKYRF
jgi:hypothetical protein